MWDLEARKPLFALSSGQVCMYYTSWRFSPNGNTIMLRTDTTLRLFDAKTGRERAVVGHRYPVTPRFSADGRFLVTNCPELTCTWDLTKKPKEALVSREPRKAWEVLAWGYSADGRHVLERSASAATGPGGSRGAIGRAPAGARRNHASIIAYRTRVRTAMWATASSAVLTRLGG